MPLTLWMTAWANVDASAQAPTTVEPSMTIAVCIVGSAIRNVIFADQIRRPQVHKW